jgi:delta 1-pyrroline-5-carboxylate dehydrogenase
MWPAGRRFPKECTDIFGRACLIGNGHGGVPVPEPNLSISMPVPLEQAHRVRRQPHFAPRAMHVVSLHMIGAPSTLELFDQSTSKDGSSGVCSACSRVVVMEGIHDAFLNRLIEATRNMKLAPAEDPGCGVGPVINETARRRIEEAIDRGKRESRLIYAGDVGPLQEGSYVGPHIFAYVPPGSFLGQEEIFGPVLAVIKARDLDHVLEIANGTAYALTGGIYSRSPEHIAHVKRDLRVGNLYINRKITGALVDRQPFGGFKLSGIGSKAGGPDYLSQFLLPRTITENTLHRGFAPNPQENQKVTLSPSRPFLSSVR